VYSRMCVPARRASQGPGVRKHFVIPNVRTEEFASLHSSAAVPTVPGVPTVKKACAPEGARMADPVSVRASAPVCTATAAEIVVIGPAIWTVKMEGYALQIPPANVNKDFMVLVVIKKYVSSIYQFRSLRSELTGELFR